MRKVSGVALVLWFLVLSVVAITFIVSSPSEAVGDLGYAEIEDLDEDSYAPGDPVEFNAVEHYKIVLYLWNFGDGSGVKIGPSVTHNYSAYDTFKVTLMCQLDDGRWDNDTMKVDVHGWVGSDSVFVQACFLSLCLGPIVVPVLVLVGIAVGLKFLLQLITKREWSIKSLSMTGLLFICLPFFLIYSVILFLVPIGAFLLNVVCGSMLWMVAALASVFLISLVVRVLSKVSTFGLKDGLCVVRKPLPIQKKPKNGEMKFSKKNFMDFVFELSLYPLFMSFFLMSIVSLDVEDPMDFISVQNFLIISFAPIVTFLIVPIQLLLDSNLVFVRKDPRTGIFIVYLGASVRNLFQGLLGVGAIVAFLGVFLNFGSGGEIEQFMWGIVYLFLVIAIVFPNVLVVAFIYSWAHNKFVKMLNNQMDNINLPEYRVKENKEDRRYLALVPIKYQTWTMEKIEKSLPAPPPVVEDGAPPPPTKGRTPPHSQAAGRAPPSTPRPGSPPPPPERPRTGS